MIQELKELSKSFIPEGPAYAAVALAALALAKSVTLEALKYKRNGNGNGNGYTQRSGTRRTDDIKLDRNEIERELDMSRLVNDTHDLVGDLVEAQKTEGQARTEFRVDMKVIYERLTSTLEAVKSSNDLQAKMLGVAVTHVEEIRVQLARRDKA